MEAAHHAIMQPGATYANADTQPHDATAVSARKALGCTYTHALGQSTHCGNLLVKGKDVRWANPQIEETGPPRRSGNPAA